MDLKTGSGEANKGNANSEHHRFSPGPDLSMLQKNYVHRDNASVAEEMMTFNQGYEMPPNNNLEQNCNETGATPNRIHPFGPFTPTPPGSGTNNNGGSPFCVQSGSVVAAAAAAAGLSQQSQLNNNQGPGAPPSFMDNAPSFCSAPYNYSLYSMQSQDSRVKLEKEKEAAAAVAAYNNKHSVEDKELAAAKWITS